MSEEECEDELTESTEKRKPWLGTVLALITVISPYVYAGYQLHYYGSVAQWLIAIIMVVSLTGAVWWAGAGAVTKASEIMGGGN